jgi:hypothetical protein
VEALPRYTFQTAYASDAALRDKRDELVGVMAAYGALYDYLMTPEAHDAFLEARKGAQKKFDAASAQAIRDFNRTQRPYSRDLSLSDEDIGYLQDMFIGVGSLTKKQPVTGGRRLRGEGRGQTGRLDQLQRIRPPSSSRRRRRPTHPAEADPGPDERREIGGIGLAFQVGPIHTRNVNCEVVIGGKISGPCRL